MKHRLLFLGALALALSSNLAAQPLLRVPQVSPRAISQETFGITDVKVDYHRPSVNNRRIFGGLVPYDVIWRAGANENTLVSFSTPVSVEGQPLAAGTYSLFLVPGQQQWTVVFNAFTGGWGTYSYDQSQDVLRVKVTPAAADMQERLAYTFDDAKADAVTLNLRWEKVRVPIRLSAETTKLTMASIKDQLRSGLHWVPQAWREGAGYALRNNEIDTALAWADTSINQSADAFNLRLKARILEKKGDAAGAKALREQAAALSPELTAISGAYESLGAKKPEEAMAKANAWLAKHPDSWRAYSALGTIYASKGDSAKSKEAFDKAMGLAPSQSEKVEVQDSLNDLGSEAK